jgi:hypothetical protein
VPDPTAVVQELGRVLRPGGRFIHWLDMSTLLAPAVAALAGTDLLVLPNVFGDPSSAAWPEDLFILPRPQLATVAAILHRHRHPLARPLAQYVATFSTSPLAVGAAVAELVQLQEDGHLRSALFGAFRAATELAQPEERARLADFTGRPVSSARHFEQRLRGWFGEGSGFRVEQSDLHRVWETSPRVAGAPPYLSSCVGEQRVLQYVPEAFLCSDARAPLDDETLTELGMFVFVATRI